MCCKQVYLCLSYQSQLLQLTALNLFSHQNDPSILTSATCRSELNLSVSKLSLGTNVNQESIHTKDSHDRQLEIGKHVT